MRSRPNPLPLCFFLKKEVMPSSWISRPLSLTFIWRWMDGWEKTKKKKTQTFEYLDFTALFFVRVCCGPSFGQSNMSRSYSLFFLSEHVNYSVNVTSSHPSSIGNLRWEKIDAFLFSCCCFLPKADGIGIIAVIPSSQGKKMFPFTIPRIKRGLECHIWS